MGLNICGRCAAEYATEQGYLDHVCPATGHDPTVPANPRVQALISEAALSRGEERSGEEKSGAGKPAKKKKKR